MSTSATKEIIERFYNSLLQQNDIEAVINLFAKEVDWDIPGDNTIAPWVGPRHTKTDIRTFFILLAKNVEPVEFNIDYIVAEGDNAVAVGTLASRMLKTHKIFRSKFTAVFKVEKNKITRYYLLEDSHGLVESLN